MEKKNAYVIAVINQKGGAGKTTVTRNVGYSLKNRGLRVLLFDADPQGSLRNWSANGSGEILPVVGVDMKDTISSSVKEFQSLYDIIIVDSRPSIGPSAAEIIKVADLVLIPVLPSQDDVDASLPIIDLIKARQEVSNKPNAYFLINKSKRNTKTSKAIVKYISNMEDQLPCINTAIGSREVYIHTFSTGDTVFQSEDPLALPAMREIEEITNQLMDIKNGI
jgi:chromosome partitioning protein